MMCLQPKTFSQVSGPSDAGWEESDPQVSMKETQTCLLTYSHTFKTSSKPQTVLTVDYSIAASPRARSDRHG